MAYNWFVTYSDADGVEHVEAYPSCSAYLDRLDELSELGYTVNGGI